MEGFVLTIPEALAIVGSVATVVLGIFGYLLKLRAPKDNDRNIVTPPKYLETQVQGAHDHISDMKDRVGAVESEVRLLESKLDALRQAVADHQVRDDQDHDVFEKKLDKLMDILIKILTDDKL